MWAEPTHNYEVVITHYHRGGHLLVAPSVLAADFRNMASEAKNIEKASKNIKKASGNYKKLKNRIKDPSASYSLGNQQKSDLALCLSLFFFHDVTHLL